MVVSPYSRANAVDHTFTQQSSVIRFIEDNWHLGRIGDASFDARAGSLSGMFDFRHPDFRRVLLNKDGSVKSVGRIPDQVPVASSAQVDKALYSGKDMALAADSRGAGLPAAAVAGAAAVVALAGGAIAFGLIRRRKRAVR